MVYDVMMQESGFMTEDMISQQADVFEKMGTSEDAAQSRAKMQSRHLRSGKIIDVKEKEETDRL